MNNNEKLKNEISKEMFDDFFMEFTVITEHFPTLNKRLDEISKVLKESSDSATKLSTVLNKITICICILGGASVLVELIKLFSKN